MPEQRGELFEQSAVLIWSILLAPFGASLYLGSPLFRTPHCLALPPFGAPLKRLHLVSPLFGTPSIWNPLLEAPFGAPSIWSRPLGPPAQDLFGGKVLLLTAHQLNSKWEIISSTRPPYFIN